MRVLIFAAALCVAGCTTTSAGDAGAGVIGGVVDGTVNTKPNDMADLTPLDERIGLAATETYTTLSKRGQALVEEGKLDREKFKAADRRGFIAVQLIRRAYDTSNATTYSAAIRNAYKAADEIAALLNGG